MIQKFNDYGTTKSYEEIEQLPKGGYVLIIKNAVVKQGNNGDYVQASCDIAEGQYKDYFMKDWKNQSGEDKKWHCNYLLNIPTDDGSEQDGWTKRRFKTFTEAMEASNDNYYFDWDETEFKGKLIGGLFNVRQYRAQDGTIRDVTNLKRICSVAMIRENGYRLPKDDLLKESPKAPSAEPWMVIPETETPFN